MNQELKNIILEAVYEATTVEKYDYIGGIVQGEVIAERVPVGKSQVYQHNDFPGLYSGANHTNWRYKSEKNQVFWNLNPESEDKIRVSDFLSKRGIVNVKHKNMYNYEESLKESLGTDPFDGWDKSKDGKVIIGWRAGEISNRNHGKGGNTEGDGTYISQKKEMAEMFGDAKPYQFHRPKKTLVVNEEPLWILWEMDPINPKLPDGNPLEDKHKESIWGKLNKIAILQADKTTGGDWNKGQTLAGSLLTKYIKKLGYDSVVIYSGEDVWAVLFNPDIVKESFDSSFEADYGRGEEYVEVFKNPTTKELLRCKPHHEIGAVLSDKDAYVWNRQLAYHGHVMTHLKLTDGLPLMLIPDNTNVNRMDVMVTDASRRGKWHHNPETAEFVKNHPFFRNKRLDNVSYWDEDVVGDWTLLKS